MAGIRLCGFLIELWEYQLGMKAFFSVRLRRKWMAAVGIVLYGMLAFSGWIKEEYMYLSAYALTVALIFFMADTNWKRKAGEIPILLFIISCMESFFEEGVYAVLKWHGGTVLARKWDYLGGSIVTLGVLAVLVIFHDRKHRKEKEDIIRFIPKWMGFFVILMAVEVILTVTGLSYAKKYIMDDRFRIFAGLLSSAAYFAVCILGIFFIYIKKINERLELAVETERRLKEMQKKYYEDMLMREEETRKYRHDLRNHLICLYGLAKEEQAKKVMAYIRNMEEQARFIQQKFYTTGNKVLDALVNYYGSLIELDTRLRVSGKVEHDLEITDTDLCTVFGNLLQNAVEGVMRVQGGEKYIWIQFEQGREYLRIRIENSAVFPENNILQTKKFFTETIKKDKRDHGIGISNVQETVKRYQGKVNVLREGQKVVAEVILRNRATV